MSQRAALHALLMPQVHKTGNARQGYDFNIRFDPVSTPGNLPLLRVASLDQLTGACMHIRAAVVMMVLDVVSVHNHKPVQCAWLACLFFIQSIEQTKPHQAAW